MASNHIKVIKLRWQLCPPLLLLFLTSLIGVSGNAPRIINQIVGNPSPVWAGVNVAVLIQAGGNGVSDNLQFIWTKDDKVVLDGNVNFLTISNTNVSASGVYRCLVKNTAGTARSLPYKLEVKEFQDYSTLDNVTITVQEGDSVTLKLPTNNYDPSMVQIFWEKDGSFFPTNTRIYYQTILSGDLILLDTPVEGAKYQARISKISGGGATYSPFYFVGVTALPDPDAARPLTFVENPKDISVLVGTSEVVFECVVNVRNTAALVMNWYFGTSAETGTLLMSDSKYQLGLMSRQLKVKNIVLQDAGVYLCEASLSGQASSSITTQATLTVIEPPTLVTPTPPKVLLDFQQSFALNCDVSGSENMTREWYFNGEKLPAQGSRYQVHPNGTLEIPLVDVPDSGVYQCFASNEGGEVDTYTYLEVNSAEPTVVRAPQDTIVAEEEDASFICEVRGGPKPDVVWTKDNQRLVLGGPIQVVGDRLIIGAVTLQDAGLYTCTATNIKGSASAGARLTVILKTRITKPPQQVSRILTTSANLACDVRHDPSVTPSWEWYFYPAPSYNTRTQINPGGKHQILANGTLVIDNLAGGDSGIYECIVSSAGGGDSRNGSINVIDLPFKPTIQSVELYDQQPNSVLVKWFLSYDGDTPITRFIIQIRKESVGGVNSNNDWDPVLSRVDPGLSQIVVGGLHPSSYYRFRVIAVNEVGSSPPSDPAPPQAIKMPAQPPSEPPRNLYVGIGNAQELTVSWEPPPEAAWNGDPRGYYIFYKVYGFDDSTERRQVVLGKDVRQAVIKNLAYYKKYRVKIAAFNEMGGGVNSTEYVATTDQGVPSEPPQQVELSSPNSTTIRIQWDPPPARLLNGENLGYEIELKESGNRNLLAVPFDDNNPTGRQTFDIPGLLKYTEYEVKISCRTGKGLGPFSDPKIIRTQEDVPGPVEDLKYDLIQDQILSFSWKRPLKVNGILTGYEICYMEKADPSTKDCKGREASATSHTLQGLKYKTTYVITVQAKTRVGLGPERVLEIDSGVPPTLPGMPTRLGVSEVGARSVRLAFSPGDDGNTIILLWVVEAQIGDSTDWVEVFTINAPDAEEFIVQNLRPYTRYTLRVIAENVVGRSPPSLPCPQFQTNQAPPGMPPTDVSTRAVNSTVIRIIWGQIPRTEWNGEFVGYKIHYRRWSKNVDVNTTSPSDLEKLRETDWTVVTLRNGSTIQEYSLTNLEEWMDYQIWMTSYNNQGSSEPTPTLDEMTDEGVPSASPSNILVVATSSTNISVTWGPVPILQQNGYIMGYKVTYRIQFMDSVPMVKEVLGADTYGVMLTGLRKYTEYEVRLLAFTRMGDGLLSPIYAKRTASDIPGPPVNVYFPQVTLTSVLIVWQAPDEPNGQIVAYRVSWRRENEPESVMANVPNSEDKSPTDFQHEVIGLTRETFYIFSVVAKTEDGWGQSATVKVYTYPDRERPTRPGSVRVEPSLVQARAATVNWVPGDDNYGPVRNFTVQFQKVPGSWQTVEATIPPEYQNYTVQGLRPYTAYKFRVAATNDVGTSEFSTESNMITTKQDKPDGAPENVTIRALSRTQIRISWDPPPASTLNGILTKDIVQYREEKAMAYREEEVPVGQNVEELSGLTIGVKYEIRVVTCNTVGCSPPSALQVFLVGDVAPFAAPLDVQVVNRSSTELEINWKPPPEDTLNGKLINYKILYWVSPDYACVEHNPKQKFGKGPSLVLTDLTPFTIYCSTVQAVNLAGEGPKSIAMPGRTSEAIPGPPMRLRFNSIDLDNLIVLWDPPMEPNGRITFYELQYSYESEDQREFDRLTRKIDGNITELFVSDLVQEHLYTFTLSANNSVGRGVPAVSSVFTGPQPGSPERPTKPSIERKGKDLVLSWKNGNQGASTIKEFKVYSQEADKDGTPYYPDQWTFIRKEPDADPTAQIPLSRLRTNTYYRFIVRAVNNNGISEASPATDLYLTPTSVLAASSEPFYTQWWFLVIVALSGVILILLLITMLCLLEKRRNKGKELKRSTTNTTVMSETMEPEDGGFPSMEMRQSRRSLNRNGKVQNNIYARSPPRPSPASVTYSEGLGLPVAGAAAASVRPHMSDDGSSVLSDKPSNLGDSSDELSSDDSDDSSNDSIAKAPVPASPPPPAFSSHYRKSGGAGNHHNIASGSGATASGGAKGGGSSSSSQTHNEAPPPWRFQNPHNAYTYTDSEAESSHYAFTLNNGNIVVNNVAGARTPLSGFSSFV